MKKHRKIRKDLSRLAAFLKKETSRLEKVLAQPCDEGVGPAIAQIYDRLRERHLQSMADLVTVLASEASLAAEKEASKRAKEKSRLKKTGAKTLKTKPLKAKRADLPLPATSRKQTIKKASVPVKDR